MTTIIKYQGEEQKAQSKPVETPPKSTKFGFFDQIKRSFHNERQIVKKENQEVRYKVASGIGRAVGNPTKTLFSIGSTIADRVKSGRKEFKDHKKDSIKDIRAENKLLAAQAKNAELRERVYGGSQREERTESRLPPMLRGQTERRVSPMFASAQDHEKRMPPIFGQRKENGGRRLPPIFGDE
jgi:hypothetical protein